MSDNNTKAAIAKDIRMEAGTAAPVKDAAPQAKAVLSFSMDGVYIGLKPDYRYDEVSKTYEEQAPKITASFFNNFITVPQSGKFWRALGKFATELGEAIGDTDLSKARVGGSTNAAKELLAKF